MLVSKIILKQKIRFQLFSISAVKLRPVAVFSGGGETILLHRDVQSYCYSQLKGTTQTTNNQKYIVSKREIPYCLSPLEYTIFYGLFQLQVDRVSFGHGNSNYTPSPREMKKKHCIPFCDDKCLFGI